MSHRSTYVVAAIATIVFGLVVHLGFSFLPPSVRDVTGDALWAMMMLWWISAIWPNARVLFRAGLALAISWIVELSQLYQAPMLDAIRATLPGRLVLGSGFDPRDLAAYALGIVAGILIERRTK